MPNDSTETGIQHRGHCQCCAREQAVLHTGHMAKHGYTVKQGWFQGACSGSDFEPLETDHTRSDAIIQQVLAECDTLIERHDKLKEGYIKPETLNVIRRVERSFERVPVAYEDCTVTERNDGINSMLWKIKNRIRAGELFIDMLRGAIKEYHGKPLIQAKKKDAPEPIQAGDIKVSQRGRLRVDRVTGGNVCWVDERGFIGKSSTRYWRQLPDTEEKMVENTKPATQRIRPK